MEELSDIIIKLFFVFKPVIRDPYQQIPED